MRYNPPKYYDAEVERQRDRVMAQGLYKVLPRKPRGSAALSKWDRFMAVCAYASLVLAAIAIYEICK